MPNLKTVNIKTICYHCGDVCPDEKFHLEDKYFCCFGCQTVYEILNANDLCNYYNFTEHPGINRKNKVNSQKYSALDKIGIKSKFISFTDGNQTHVIFVLPVMHCSSCIWLLEHLHKLNSAILQSRVDFLKKEVTIIYDESSITLSAVAELLDAVGYEPLLSFQDLESKSKPVYNPSAIIKIGIAGFAFGNIMLMAFPEYFGGSGMQNVSLNGVFRYISLLLSIPVFFYCASEFFVSSWKSLRKGYLNIDVPIALAIILTFARSLYAIFIENKPGYFDSMTGIVFFMLVGRYFQNLTYRNISFDRNYKSYFPLSVSKLKNDKEEQVALSEILVGDIILIHNGELIPADAILVQGKGNIDYSFVTGESEPLQKCIGELIYAGGKQIGPVLQLKVIKDVSQSYLTQLWNNTDVKIKENEGISFIHLLGRYFAFVVLGLSITAGVFWFFQGDSSRALDALITPMIVACPCALLLSATFTNGNAIRYLGRFGVYLKNASVIEKLTKVDTIVFDKTGTLTLSDSDTVTYSGDALSNAEKELVFAIASESQHPYSKAIRAFLKVNNSFLVTAFSELIGKGMEGIVNGDAIKIGSALFIGISNTNAVATSYLTINGVFKGKFEFHNKLRNGLGSLVDSMMSQFNIYVLSGDNVKDKILLENYFNPENLYFNQSPENKLNFIKNLKSTQKNVMMLGDGLNDAGALQQSDVGIALTQGSHFTPASDIIMEANQLQSLNTIFSFARRSRNIVLGSFVMSILYNICGLYFALQGLLSPVIAAILMPLSTISIVLFTTGMTALSAKMILKKNSAASHE